MDSAAALSASKGGSYIGRRKINADSFFGLKAEATSAEPKFP